MADTQQQQYIPKIGELVRVVNPQVTPLQSQQLQGSPNRQMTDMTGQAFQQANQAVGNIQNYVQQTMESAAKTAAAQAAGDGKSMLAQELMGLGQATIEGYKFYKQVTLQEQQQAEEKRKQAMAQVAATSAMAIREATFQMQEQIRNGSYEEGTRVTRRNVDAILQQAAQAGLDPTELAKLQELAYAPIYDVEQTKTRQTYEAAQQARQSYIAVAEGEVMFKASTMLGQLATATPEQANNLITDMMRLAAESTQGLDPSERAQIFTRLFNEAAKETRQYAANQSVITQRREKLNQFITQYNAWRAEGLDQTNPEQFRQQVAALAWDLGVSELVSSMPTYDSGIQAALDRQKNENALAEAVQDSTSGITIGDKATADNAEIAALVHGMINGGNVGDAWREFARSNRASQAQRAALRNAEDFLGTGPMSRQSYQQLRQQYHSALAEMSRVYQQVNPNVLGPRQIFMNQQDAFGNQLQDPRRVLVERDRSALPQEYTQLERRAGLLFDQITGIVQHWRERGINIDNPRDESIVKQYQSQAAPILERAQQLQQQRQRSNVSLPGLGNYVNPNSGVAAGYPATPSRNAFGRAQAGSVSVPTPSTPNVQMVITRDFDGSGRVGRGSASQAHGYMAIDFAPVGNVDAPALTFQGGTVVHASPVNGYGGTVVVQTPDGHYELHAHLRGFNVRVGQRIAPGTSVGLIGGGGSDPMAGTSTGRHHHFEVFRGAWNPANRVNPYEYLQRLNVNVVGNRGVGLPPNQAQEYRQTSRRPVDGEYLGNGQYFIGGQVLNLITGQRRAYVADSRGSGGVVQAGQVFNRTSPMRNQFASINRQDYPRRNSPNNNYGYAALRDDAQFARATARVADQLGIPAQWLADIMAFESAHTFSPATTNSDGCIGMIQLCSMNWYHPTQNPNVPRDWRPEIIRNMTRAQYVERVVLPFLRGRQYRTVEDVLAKIFGGDGLYQKSPQERARIGDVNIRFRNYMDRLGEGVGRRYRHSYVGGQANAAPTHTQYVASCGSCARQASMTGEVLPHAANPIG